MPPLRKRGPATLAGFAWRPIAQVVNRFGRAKRISGSQAAALDRAPLPHPDAARPTRRMPFDQLRALVTAVIEAEDEDGDPVAEFETRPTTYRPTRPSRVSTLDEVIESLLRGN